MLNKLIRTLISMGAVLFSVAANPMYADDWSPLWTTTSLSQPRALLTATATGGKAFFAGGSGQNGLASNVVDIYDMATNTWSTTTLSSGRVGLGATSLGDKAFFAGGWSNNSYFNTVDIYDTATNTWSTATLSQAREYVAATAINGKAFFGGGSWPGNTVDIYDNATNTWSTATLSQGRCDLAAASANGKVFFGGGDLGYPTPSGVVDIYDTNTRQWSTSALSSPRESLAATSCNGKVFFAGGGSDLYTMTDKNTVDIYDTATNSWSTATLSQARQHLAATSLGNKVLFAGGSIGSSTVDIYDAGTGLWSTARLSVGRNYLTATSVGNKAFFAGGQTWLGSICKDVDIYTLQHYETINSSKIWTLVDQTTVDGGMQLNAGASLNLDSYDLTIGSMNGVAPINLSAHTLTAGSDNTDSTYSGSISGNGTIVKTGNGVLSLCGSNSYLGRTTVKTGELYLIGQDAWNPITNLGGAYLSDGELVFDYSGSSDPYAAILGIIGTKITGSASLCVTDDAANSRVIVSAVPEPSVISLASVGVLALLAYTRRRRI
jgi:autotransporter-associated beta strand protein